MKHPRCRDWKESSVCVRTQKATTGENPSERQNHHCPTAISPPSQLTIIQFWHYPELNFMGLRAESSTRLPLLQMSVINFRSPHTSDQCGYKFESSRDSSQFWQSARTSLRAQGITMLTTRLVIMATLRVNSKRVLDTELPCCLHGVRIHHPHSTSACSPTRKLHRASVSKGFIGDFVSFHYVGMGD